MCATCATGYDSAPDCNACASGYYNAGVGSLDCVALGHQCLTGSASMCMSCATGYDASVSVTNDCTSCASGYYESTSAPPLASLVCTLGHECVSGSAIICFSCTAGYEPSSTDTHCDSCSVGYYVSASGASVTDLVCTLLGHQCNAGDAIDCSTCATGYMTDGASNNCRQCDYGFLVTAGTAGNSDDVVCSAYHTYVTSANLPVDLQIPENGYVPGAQTKCYSHMSNCYTCASMLVCTSCRHPYSLVSDACECSAPNVERCSDNQYTTQVSCEGATETWECIDCTQSNCAQCSAAQTLPTSLEARYIKLDNFGDRSSDPFGFNIGEIIVRSSLTEENLLHTASGWKICYGQDSTTAVNFPGSWCMPDLDTDDPDVLPRQREVLRLYDGNGNSQSGGWRSSFRPEVGVSFQYTDPWLEIDFGDEITIVEIVVQNANDPLDPADHKSWIVDANIEARDDAGTVLWSATFEGEADWYAFSPMDTQAVEEKTNRENFRVLPEMRILVEIKVGILDFAGLLCRNL